MVGVPLSHWLTVCPVWIIHLPEIRYQTNLPNWWLNHVKPSIKSLQNQMKHRTLAVNNHLQRTHWTVQLSSTKGNRALLRPKQSCFDSWYQALEWQLSTGLFTFNGSTSGISKSTLDNTISGRYCKDSDSQQFVHMQINTCFNTIHYTWCGCDSTFWSCSVAGWLQYK